MAKIRIEWTTTVTETYMAEVDYDDFAKVMESRDREFPNLDEIKAGRTYVEDWDNAGAEFEDAPDMASVDSREIDSITVIED